MKNHLRIEIKIAVSVEKNLDYTTFDLEPAFSSGLHAWLCELSNSGCESMWVVGSNPDDGDFFTIPKMAASESTQL